MAFAHLKYIAGRGITAVLLVSLFACHATKYVPEDEYLLGRVQIENNGRYVKNEDLEDYVKQKPNKSIFGYKLYLHLYNLSSPEKDNWFQRSLKKIGEPPVIYNSGLQKRTVDQLLLYMQTRGYYNAEVRDSVVVRKQTVKVIYKVDPKRPYRIRNIDYFFEDGNLGDLVMSDTANKKVRQGDIFDVDLLESERVRIEKLLRNNGYYQFSKDFIYFDVDSSLRNYQVDLVLGIRKYPVTDAKGYIHQVPHKVFRINQVFLNTDFDAFYRAGDSTKLAYAADTVQYDSVYLVYPEEHNIKPGVVTQNNYIGQGEIFNQENVERTYRNLSSLSAFRLVDIVFRENRKADALLDCEIRLVPSVSQSFTFEVEGTNSGGNIGAAGNLIYQNRNFFRGSEQFDLLFKGAIETIRETQQSGYKTMLEFGVEGKLKFPKFLLPFKSEQFIRKYNPKTYLTLSYNYQKRPDFTRTMATASLSYAFRSSSYLSHVIFPLEGSLILTPYKSPEFEDWLKDKYLYYSYQPHFIVDTRYGLTFSNQNVNKKQDFVFARLNAESAGNILYFANKYFIQNLLPEGNSDSSFQILGVDYAQYLKGDIELRYYDYLEEGLSFVTRAFIGVGYPYLNSGAMPFEKQYFSGGANSIRAWQVKSLGPGSYKDTDTTNYPNQTGDVKIEFNFEYRFKMFWKLEGALFLDVGNIWSLAQGDDREGALFAWNRFYKEMAVGTGFGARFDFSYFILRLDLGLPLRDPSYPEGERWLPGNSGVSLKDVTLNIGIGYPF